MNGWVIAGITWFLLMAFVMGCCKVAARADKQNDAILEKLRESSTESGDQGGMPVPPTM